ncbi:carbamoyl phosphate synthase small subunit [Halobacillus yeomjeoni]|uniref:carbamoyl phosphate synthase small subunit n=1 Tax=Halobacillus yeomjeoni TaxID=311194 RepID=UPI001CD803DF|nr:carbamoyl phosphate synthase small subunit [Halobacillus yeomjeoni]MCA0985278.1 carbamoyl phosphate synthase small subunit [Halobacillus yeomjeoni]
MKGYLCFTDGLTFEGAASNQWESDIQGEIVFFTGMTGYQEVLTDPSYKGQIVVFTYPLIGNYGINEDDAESGEIQVKGVVMASCSDSTSHYKATTSLKDYLNDHNIPYLTEIDTREIAKTIRTGGTRQACLSNHTAPSFVPTGRGQAYQAIQSEIESHGDGMIHIGLIDFGWKKSILSSLISRNVRVTIIPFTNIDHIWNLQLNAVVLSNGPGDPKDLMGELPGIKKVLEQYPSFGICMGHQIIALAYGADTMKLPFGHRGANHPVKDEWTGKVFLSSQNHSYVVDERSLSSTPLKVRFTNVNDGSVEGLVHADKPIMSAQFHPEAHPGPEDAEWLFDTFFEELVMKKGETVYG